MASTRRLAAILAADVAGYSRLMGADEEGTHERFKAHRRELVDPKKGEHSGRIVKTTGDGRLVEFASRRMTVIGSAPFDWIIMAMSNLDTLIQDLVIANRILAKEDVVDAYGHVSVRHPDDPSHFLIARSLAPELVTAEDIVELGLDGQPVGDEKRTLYLERFIHAAIFEARPDVMAVVHAHAEDTLAFGIANATKLRPVIHSGSFIGTEVPVWDIADNFGDTNLLVTNMEQGRDLAKCLGGNNVTLMRGHGFASAGRS